MKSVIRWLFRRAEGGQISHSTRPSGSVLMRLSEGKQITDPDEAEALGLTVDARRLREGGAG
jgi:hypothetical protein